MTLPKLSCLHRIFRTTVGICILTGASVSAQPAQPTPATQPVQPAKPAQTAQPASAGTGAAQAPAAARFREILATPEQLAQLRKGGYVLYLRHGNTDNSRPDRIPSVDLADCSTQRPLNDTGRAIAADVGKAVRSAGIPVGSITISPLCRVQETARLAFPGMTFVTDNDLMYTANLTDAQKVPIVAKTRQLLSTPTEPGTNRLVIAHAPNLMDLIGYFPKEATLVIFRPGGSAGFEYIASVPAGSWPTLLREETGK